METIRTSKEILKEWVEAIWQLIQIGPELELKQNTNENLLINL